MPRARKSSIVSMAFKSASVSVLSHGFHALEKVQHARDAQLVEDLGAALFVEDDPDVSQDAQMSRNSRHFDSDHIGEFADATFAAGEFIHDEQPCGMRESFEDPGLRLESGVYGSGHIRCLDT